MNKKVNIVKNVKVIKYLKSEVW